MERKGYWTFVVNYHTYAVEEYEDNIFSITRIDQQSRPENGAVMVDLGKKENIWRWIDTVTINEADRPDLINRISKAKKFIE